MSTPSAEAAGGAGQELRRRSARPAGAADGATDTDAAYMRLHAAGPIDDTDLQAVGWTGHEAADQSTPRGVAVPRRRKEAQSCGKQQRGDGEPSTAPQPSATASAVHALCCGLLKLLVGVGLLLGVLVVVLLAIPDAELEGDADSDRLSGDAQMGNWDAAFFCDDELQRAGRILKSSNFVARAAGMSNGHSNESDACVVIRRALVLTKELHTCVAELWRKRGVAGVVTPAQLRHPEAWWNAFATSAIKSASVPVLERSQALHLALSLQLPWVVETLVERKVGVEAAAGPCGLTPMLRAVRAGDKDAVLTLYRAGANLTAADCRGCLAHHLEADADLAWQLRTWTQCGSSSSIQQCLSAHHGHSGGGSTRSKGQDAQDGRDTQDTQDTQEVELVGDSHTAQERLATERACRAQMLESDLSLDPCLAPEFSSGFSSVSPSSSSSSSPAMETLLPPPEMHTQTAHTGGGRSGRGQGRPHDAGSGVGGLAPAQVADRGDRGEL